MDINHIKHNSIVEIARQKYGYKVHEKSCARYPYLVNGDHKIFVKKGKKGFEVFASRESEVDGTIIDFVMFAEKCNMASAISIIEDFYGSNKAPNKHQISTEIAPDNIKNIKKINYLIKNIYEDCRYSEYLKSRGITTETLKSRRFRGTIKKTKEDVVLFPHKDKESFKGWEARGHKFKGFCKHGEKRLWVSNCFKTDETLILAESAIDALSYFQIYQTENARYMSIAGRANEYQIILLRYAIERVQMVKTIFDNGSGGDKLRDDINLINKNVIHEPPQKKYADYNEMLMKGGF